jgi:hypothetical protein
MTTVVLSKKYIYKLPWLVSLNVHFKLKMKKNEIKTPKSFLMCPTPELFIAWSCKLSSSNFIFALLRLGLFAVKQHQQKVERKIRIFTRDLASDYYSSQNNNKNKTNLKLCRILICYSDKFDIKAH